MNELVKLVASGKITLDDLNNVNELIRRVNFINKGIEACKKTLIFPFGEDTINCYSHKVNGTLLGWGECSINGIFRYYDNDGKRLVYECNLLKFKDVFMAFENIEFAPKLGRFLKKQIEIAEKKEVERIF